MGLRRTGRLGLLALVLVLAAAGMVTSMSDEFGMLGSSEMTMKDQALRVLRDASWQSSAKDCVGALDCWLKGIEFVIPDITQKGIKVGPLKYKLKLSGLVCHGVQVGGIDSAHLDDASLDIKVNDLGTKCTGGKWSLKGAVSYSGTLSITISKTNLEVDVALATDEAGLPSEAELRRCGISSIDVGYHFGDSALGWVLDLFESQITPKIEKGIKDSVCGVAEQAIDDKLNPLLQDRVDPWIAELVAHGPSPVPDQPPGMLNWNESHLVVLVNKAAEALEANINDVIDRVSNGTGSFVVPLNTTKVLPISDPQAGTLGNVTLIFRQLSVTGVDTFTEIDLLTPSPGNPLVLDSAVRMGRLDADVLVTVLVNEAQGALSGQGLNETFVVSFAARNVGVVASLAAVVEEAAILNLLIGEAIQVGCLLGTLRYLSIISFELELDLDALSILEDNAAPLEEDVDELINNVLRFPTEDYHDLVTAMAVGAAQGPLRDVLNAQLASAVADFRSTSGCTAPNNEVLYVDWMNSSLVAQAGQLVNERIGPAGLDTFVDRLTPHSPGEVSFDVPRPLGYFHDVVLALFGLDTFTDFQFLIPRPDYHLYNEFAMDTFGFRLAWAPLGSGHGDPNMNFTVSGLEFALDTLLQIDYDMVLNQRVGEVLDLLRMRNMSQNAACLFEAVDALRFAPPTAKVEDAHFFFQGREGGKKITDIVNAALSGGLAELVKVFNDLIGLMMDDAAYVCAGEPLPYPEACPFPLSVEAPCSGGVIECLLRENMLEVRPLELGWQGYELNVTSLRCQSLDRLAFESTLQADGSLHVELKDAGFGCRGGWSYRLPGAEAAVTGEVCGALNHSSLAFDIAMGASQMLPDYLQLVNCKAGTVDFAIEFAGGGAAGFLLNAGRRALNKGISSMIQQGICMALTSFANPKLSAWVQNDVDPRLQELLDEVAQEPPRLPGMVDWAEIPFFEDSMRLLNDAIAPDAPCLGLNGIARSLTNGTGEADFPLGDVIVALPWAVMGQDLKVVLHGLKLGGLDSFKNLTLFAPGSHPDVLHSSWALEHLRGELHFGIMTEGASMVSSEDLRVSLCMADVAGVLDLYAAVDATTMTSLYVDQLGDLGCLLSTLLALNVSSLRLDVGSMEVTTAAVGSVTDVQAEVLELANGVAAFLLTEHFQPLVTGVLRGWTQGTVRQQVNANLEAQLATLRLTFPTCVAHTWDGSLPALDFRTSKALKFFDTLLNEELGAEGVNQAMECVTQGTGNLTEALSLAPAGLEGAMRFTLMGLTSFYGMRVAMPATDDGKELDSFVAVGALDPPRATVALGSPRPPYLAGPFGVAVEMPDVTTLRLAAQNLAVELDVRLAVNASRLGNLTVAQIGEPYCAMTSLDTAEVETFGVHVEAASLDVWAGDTARGVNLTAATNQLESTLAANGVREGLNAILAEQIASAEERCRAGGILVVPEEGEAHGGVWVIAGICIVVGLILAWACWENRRQGDACGIDRWISCTGRPRSERSAWEHATEGAAYAELDEVRDDAEGANPYAPGPPRLQLRSKSRELLMPALLRHPAVPIVYRVGVPLGVVVTAGLFIWSNVSNGAAVLLTLSAGDEWRYTSEPLFTFTLANSVRDMWKAGVYGLALVVLVFSGCWPYIKLLLLLVAWGTPPYRFSVQMRERLLCYLDALGKWSLVDCYVLVLMMVAFQFSIAVEADGAEAALDVLVRPEWGFYGFLLATMLSLVWGHVTLWCHRRAAGQRRVPPGGARRSLAEHHFAHPSSGARRLRASRRGRWAVLAGLAAVMIMVFVGAWTTCYSFEFQGLTGWALGASAKQPYSLVSTGQAVPAASGHPSDPGVLWIQLSFFAFALAVPLTLLALLAMLWAAPLGVATQHGIFQAAEVLYAWSAIDVFIVSVLAAMVEISQFAQFIIGDRCDRINDFLAAYMAPVIPGEPICFDVVTTLEGGCWWIFTASLCFVGAVWPLMSLCRRLVTTRLDAEGIPAEEDLGLEEALLSLEERMARRAASPPPKNALAPSTARMLLRMGMLEEMAEEMGDEDGDLDLDDDEEGDDPTTAMLDAGEDPEDDDDFM